jgi:potassium intermediate/small conductance calcium-activated channel subfamily N protein 2
MQQSSETQTPETDKPSVLKRICINSSPRYIESPRIQLTSENNNYKFTQFKPPIKTRTSDPLPIDFKFLHEYLEDEYSKEDEHQTSEYFITITIDELILCLFVILSIGSGLIYYETRISLDKEIYNKSIQKTVINISLSFVSIGVLLFIISLIPKYIHQYKLYLSARYISIKEGFCSKNFVISFIFEFVLALIHPNLLFKDYYCTTAKSWNIAKVRYNINDFLLVIMIIRLFYLIKVAILSTNYYSARADRICKMMGMRLNLFFTLKCVLIKYTSYALVLTTLTVCFGLAYMMKIIEGPVLPAINSYLDYGNCFWNVFVTMTTVGYGDYYPRSMLGRLVCFVTALCGNILVAMNINFLQSKTEISSDEERALNFIQRMEEREQMQSIAAAYFRANFTYFVNKKKMMRKEKKNGRKEQDELVLLAQNKFLKRKEFKKCLQ